jgi:hypothetical protein
MQNQQIAPKIAAFLLEEFKQAVVEF